MKTALTVLHTVIPSDPERIAAAICFNVNILGHFRRFNWHKKHSIVCRPPNSLPHVAFFGAVRTDARLDIGTHPNRILCKKTKIVIKYHSCVLKNLAQ